MVKKTSHEGPAGSKPGAIKAETRPVLGREFVGFDVLVDFFRWAGVRDDEIPGLIDQCEPGSTYRRWQQVLAGWQKAHGLASLPTPTTSEENLLPTRDAIRNAAADCARTLANVGDDDPFFLWIGRGHLQRCLASIRAMSEPAPAVPWPAQTLEEVRRGLDAVIGWCEADPDGPWSEVDTPERWAKRFTMSLDTFWAAVDGGRIRVKKLTPKRIQIYLPHVPQP